jgi:4-amino-4-deoxy-L-arabinose transferase-like glycosyltransferase
MKWMMKMNRFIDKSISKILLLIEKYVYFFAFILFIILCFSLFYNINLPNIQNFDEARHGANAYEMMLQHNLIVNYYNGLPDYWNLKPPLSFWTIMIGYKIFGFNTIGLRFFSGLSILIISIILFVFVKKRFGNMASLITLAAFISCAPIILEHCGRTGDPDALYLLFFTLSMIFLSRININIKNLYFSGLSFSFAFLTKSWHSFAILIIIGLFIIITRKLFKIRLYQYILFIIFSFLPILVWAALRYQFDGLRFFKSMIQYDLLNRSSTSIEGHTGDKWYYSNFIIQQYTYWFILLCSSFIGLITILKKDSFKKHYEQITLFMLWIIVPFLIFTLAKTKLSWYIYSIFPALSICLGSFTSKLIKTKKKILSIILIILIAFSFYSNEKFILQYIRQDNGSEIQSLLMKIDRASKYNNANIYLDNNLNWDQSTYLSALLYGNLNAKDGGMTGFVYDSHKNCLLLLIRNDENKQIMQSFHFKKIYQNDQFYLLKK